MISQVVFLRRFVGPFFLGEISSCGSSSSSSSFGSSFFSVFLLASDLGELVVCLGLEVSGSFSGFVAVVGASLLDTRVKD
jgi:hypothetical protein